MFGRTITPKRRCSASKLVRCIPDCFASSAAEASFHDKRLQIVAAGPTDLPVFDMFTGDRAKQRERAQTESGRDSLRCMMSECCASVSGTCAAT